VAVEGKAMPRVTVSDQIAAPVEKVFAVFTDVERAAERVSGIKEVRMLTPGRFSLGTRWLETRQVLGRLDKLWTGLSPIMGRFQQSVLL
jgi:hypothetical protein